MRKICTKCKKYKNINLFYNDKTKKDGKSSSCKKCIDKRCKNYNKKHRKEKSNYDKTRREKYKDEISLYKKNDYCKNKEKIILKVKKYYNKNKDKIIEKTAVNYHKNKDKIILQVKKYRRKPAPYNTYGSQLTIEEDPIDDGNNLLLCRCAKCREYFYPNCGQVICRIAALKKSKGELRLYCSDKCKQECDIFGSRITPKSLRNVKKSARCHQNINRKSLLKLQLDEYGYNYCEKCGKKFDTSDLVLHHNIMVGLHHNMADDMSHQLLCCKKHHEHTGCFP